VDRIIIQESKDFVSWANNVLCSDEGAVRGICVVHRFSLIFPGSYWKHWDWNVGTTTPFSTGFKALVKGEKKG